VKLATRAFSIVVVRSVCIRDVGVRFSQGPPKKTFSELIGFIGKVFFV
jgi:hypothetical protein